MQDTDILSCTSIEPAACALFEVEMKQLVLLIPRFLNVIFCLALLFRAG